MIRIFLSYHSPDQAAAKTLAEALRSDDAEVFFAPWALRPGAFWQPELSSAIEQADAFVMLLGAQGPGPWQQLEYYAALDRRTTTPSFALIPVLLVDEAPRLPFLSSLHIVKLPDPGAPDGVALLRAAIAGQAHERVDAPWRLVNPYRGLHALRAADADFFFGRDELTREVIERMRAGERAVWLVGNSGVGKSSIVDAGVVAALRRQRFPGEHPDAWPSDLEDSRSWLFLAMTPGEDPLYGLARAFVSQWTGPLDPERGELALSWARSLQSKQGLRGLIHAAQEAFAQSHGVPPTRFVLVIDQGEELYTRSSSAARDRFSQVLAEGLDDPAFQVLASLRSDHYGFLQSDEVLFPRTTRVDVPPLGEPALKQVVSEPARKLEARFSDDAMVEMIASSTARQPGALPLLSYLMEDMWKAMQARADGVLQWSSHPELVGVHRVLARRARDFLETCDDEQRKALKRLFTLKLAHVPLDGEVVRRRAGKDECSALEWTLVEALCGERWRLLTTGDEAGEPSAEVAHEVLLHEWDELRGWITEEHEFLRWKGQLEHDRRVWEEADRDPDALLQGVKLAQAEGWSGTRESDLGDADRRFITESIATRDRKQARRQSQRRRARALAFGTLVAVSFGAFAAYSWNVADAQRSAAQQARVDADAARNSAEQALAEALVAREQMLVAVTQASAACERAQESIRLTRQVISRTSKEIQRQPKLVLNLLGPLNRALQRQFDTLNAQIAKAQSACPKFDFSDTGSS